MGLDCVICWEGSSLGTREEDGESGVMKIETAILQHTAQVLGIMSSVNIVKFSEGIKRRRKIPSLVGEGCPEERLEHLNLKSLPAWSVKQRQADLCMSEASAVYAVSSDEFRPGRATQLDLLLEKENKQAIHCYLLGSRECV